MRCPVLDLSHLPTRAQTFTYFSTATPAASGSNGTVSTQVWQKPRGISWVFILLVGAGGNGGSGAIGANSTAAGGGGGGSGAQGTVLIPAIHIPDTLIINLRSANGSTSAPTNASAGNNVATPEGNFILYAVGGAAGGNAAGATAGAAGAAGIIGTGLNLPNIGMGFPITQLVGQVGIIGGVAVAGGALTTPNTGLRVTGGTGGGGLPAAAAVGTNGGAITNSEFPAMQNPAGGVGASVATNPAGFGTSGIMFPFAQGLTWFSFGGTGGGSTHGTATGGGLVQSNGGDGAPGCGGGGTGGALTGSTAGVVGKGGPAFCIITCW